MNEKAVASKLGEKDVVVQNEEEILDKEGKLVEKFQGDLRQLLNLKRQMPALKDVVSIEDIHHISDDTADILKNAEIKIASTGALNANGDVRSADLCNEIDRASATASKGPAAGQKSGEAGHQTFRRKGQTIVQKLTEVKEIRADFSSKAGAFESGDKKDGIGAGTVRQNEELLPFSSRDLIPAGEQNVAANFDAAKLLKSASQTRSNQSVWSGVNNTQSSPNKNNINGSTNIIVANSFAVLENEPMLVDTGMGEKQVDRDKTSYTKQPKTPGSVTEQHKPKSPGARVDSARELSRDAEQKAAAIHVDNATAGATVVTGNTSATGREQKQKNNRGAT